MNQNVDFAKMFRGFFDSGCDMVIFRYVTFFDPFAVQLCRQRSDTMFQHFAGIADSEICAFTFECLRNSPGNGFIICKTENEGVFILK